MQHWKTGMSLGTRLWIESALQIEDEFLIFFLSSSNVPKTRSTLQKLIALHKEFDHDDDIMHCYSQLVHTIEGEESVAMATPDDNQTAVTQIWVETTSYLLGKSELSPDTWYMVSVLKNSYVVYNFLYSWWYLIQRGRCQCMYSACTMCVVHSMGYGFDEFKNWFTSLVIKGS